MGITSDWTSVASFGALIVVQSLAAFGYIEARLRTVGRDAEARLATVKTEGDQDLVRETTRLEGMVVEERTERRREIDRLGSAIDGFHALAVTFASVGKTVDHLAERIDDHRASSDRALDEVKHTVRAIQSKVDAMAPYSRQRTRGAAGG